MKCLFKRTKLFWRKQCGFKKYPYLPERGSFESPMGGCSIFIRTPRRMTRIWTLNFVSVPLQNWNPKGWLFVGTFEKISEWCKICWLLWRQNLNPSLQKPAILRKGGVDKKEFPGRGSKQKLLEKFFFLGGGGPSQVWLFLTCGSQMCTWGGFILVLGTSNPLGKNCISYMPKFPSHLLQCAAKMSSAGSVCFLIWIHVQQCTCNKGSMN